MRPPDSLAATLALVASVGAGLGAQSAPTEPESPMRALDAVTGTAWRAQGNGFVSVLSYRWLLDGTLLEATNELRNAEGAVIGRYSGAYTWDPDAREIVFWTVSEGGELHRGRATWRDGVLWHEATVSGGRITAYASALRILGDRLEFHADYGTSRAGPELLRLEPLSYSRLADATSGPGPSTQAAVPDLAPEARAYLSAALDTIEAVTLGRDTISWQAIRDSAFLLASGAREASDTYGALGWALRRANRHSFLQAPAVGAASELIDGSFGYIRVPQRGGAAVPLADSLHVAIGELQTAGACGWIVDLRGNGGGNMWPMLAGIGLLLGDSIVGSFGGPDADRWFYARGVSGLLRSDGGVDTVSQVTVPVVRLRDPAAPVAVLIDAGTGSSGEAVAVAFLGRPASRTFGVPSAGYATANRGSRLPDGANMVVTTSYYTDRRGTEHSERLRPDSVFADPPVGWPFAWPSPRDRVARAAAAWLSEQRACSTRNGVSR